MLPKPSQTENNGAMEVFMQKLQTISTNGTLSLVIALGYELNLFEVLGQISSEEKRVTAEQVADKAGLKTRYVREWLSSMACADFLEVSEDGATFWLDEDKKAVLCGEFTHPAVQFNMFSQQFGFVFKTVAEVFRKDGPLGTTYDQYDDFCTKMNKLSMSMHSKHFLSDLLPMIGVHNSLEKGIEMLDVGCGSGFHVHTLAHHYPLSKFIGIDNYPDAVTAGNRGNKEKGLENATFLRHDAAHLPEDWTGRFDWVTIFDACHDQTRPDLCLQEVNRVLKPGGLFTMVEVKGTSNVFEDKKSDGDGAAFQYGISLFHCLPIGSSTKDALALGTKWGEQRARKMLKEAGFENVEVHDTPFFPGNVLYMCRK
uniref:Methyltranfer_dom domain-containing protein n=1 Tax=Steinernema glaseri TaxID=37863 RepID=A0A1I7ZJF8_9BILA